jgi:aerobic-type carbon monoxide dehydrogenase small subunit (CoxS/CutS family)
MKELLQFQLNGRPVRLTVDTDRMLLWVLRDDLGLTGTKHGCGEGACGSCTVLVDDEAVRSCQYPVGEAKARDIVTIEGLASDGKLHPLQEAFFRHNAMQCGFCTPGMILQASSFLRRNPHPTRDQIIQAMEGNLCRCGSYGRIVQAIEAGAEAMRGGSGR